MSEGIEPIRSIATYAARQHGSKVLRWLLGFGGVGLFAVSIVDSSIIPLPVPGSTDLLLLLLVARRANAFWMALAAIVGSILGGYLTWGTGEKGGEAAIKRYASGRHSQRLSHWIEAHGAVAVAVSSMLPPPVPLMPFLLAAGALGVSRRKFLISYSAARTLRYSLVAWLGATYGRRMAHAWSRYLVVWGPTITWSFVGLLIVGAIFGAWRLRQMHHHEAARS